MEVAETPIPALRPSRRYHWSVLPTLRLTGHRDGTQGPCLIARGQSGKNTAHRSWGSWAGRLLRTLPWLHPGWRRRSAPSSEQTCFPGPEKRSSEWRGPTCQWSLQLTSQGRKDSPLSRIPSRWGLRPSQQTQGPFLPSWTSTASAILVRGRALGSLTGWAVGV